MADSPTSSTGNHSPSENDCRKRKHSEQPNKENKRDKQELSVRKETSMSPFQAEYPQTYQSSSNYYGSMNGGLAAPIPMITPSMPYLPPSCFQPGSQPGLVPMNSNMMQYMTYVSSYNIPGNQLPPSYPAVYHPGNMPYPVKEKIIFSNCVLYPPNPNKKITRRAKPAGCRTVFVGNVPENATEEIMKEIFSTKGTVLAVRMNKKRFCHIQFSSQAEVEQAFELSGYNIRVDDKDDPANSNWLHVDYAPSRDDEKEEEKAAREARRRARHQVLREEAERANPVTPPFSEVELHKLLKQFKEGVFREGVVSLTTWMDKGEVHKRNSGSFFAVLQSLNHNVMKVVNEKAEFEQKYNKDKEMNQEIISNHSLLLKFIEKVFALAKGQHHLAKFPTLSVWHQQAKNVAQDVIATEQVEDNKNLHNEFSSPMSNSRLEEIDLEKKLKEAEKSIALVLEDSKRVQEEMTQKNENLIKQKERAVQERSRLQEEYYALKKKEEYCTLEKLEDSTAKTPKPQTSSIQDESCMKTGTFSKNNYQADKDTYLREAKILTDIFEFLLVHPFEVSIDYINSYLNKRKYAASSTTTISLLRRYPTLFKERVTGVGATLERKWSLIRQVSL